MFTVNIDGELRPYLNDTSHEDEEANCRILIYDVVLCLMNNTFGFFNDDAD